MPISYLMYAARKPGVDLGDIDRFRLFRHGQPPDASRRFFHATLSPLQLTFFFRTGQSLFSVRHSPLGEESQ
jgi:hypothetical protein